MSLPVFPSLPGLAWSINRSVERNTIKHDALSGKNVRLANWTYPKYHYELPFNVLRSAAAYQEWQMLEGFYNSVNGPAGLWAYDDPNDDTVTSQGFGEGDGATTSFQLVRAFGGQAAPVFLVSGTPSITIDGTPTTAFSVSAYGVVSFETPPPASALLVWSGSYFMPCQFDDDKLDVENFMFQLARVKSLKFSTVKLP
jgi:uncharacterized protein (TIGR02217 family)